MKNVINFEELKVVDLKELCRKNGIVGYSKMRKAELISALQSKIDGEKEALKEAKDNARDALGQDFARATEFIKHRDGLKKFSVEDYNNMVEDWNILTAICDSDNIDETDTLSTAKALAEKLSVEEIDLDSYSPDDLRDFIKMSIDRFKNLTTTERLKKDNMNILKMSMDDLVIVNESFTFDSSKASEFTGEAVRVGDNPKMRVVATSEDGISRMLNEHGKSSVTMFIGKMSQSAEEQLLIDAQKTKLFNEGFTDIATGKHYMPAFQNPSSVRQANMMFVEAEDWDEIMALWLEITGLKTWNNFAKAFFDKEGKVVMAKLLARVSCRGSNSFDTSKISKKWSDRIAKARVSYVTDPDVMIVKDYKTLDRPGHLELVHGKERKVTPGDGQGLASFSECALFAVNMRIFSEDNYEEFMRLWKSVGMDETKVKEGSPLDKLIKRMPLVFQIRHGEKKGILVRVNLERFKETKDIDIIIPDSVRKFIGGEWSEYPLEICNYLKRKDKYVAMNAQFIQALDYENPNALNVIVDHWFNVMKESLHDNAKAQLFHGIIRSTDEEDAGVASTLVQALRTSSDLIDESQVCNWRRDQYRKFINNMKIGRILVPGIYSYEVCDPYSLLNKWYGVDVACLKAGEFYHNGLDCKCGLFRSPLIAPFEATKVQLVEHDTYRYMRDVIIFNTEDGVWDNLGGSDFDGDQCAIVPDNTELGSLIVSGIRSIDHDVWEPAQKAKTVEFSISTLVEHLVKTAMRDRTGLITNYATNAQDVANHLKSAIYFAQRLGATTVTLLHPSAFAGCSDDVLGNHFVPRTAMLADGTKTFQIKGFVKTTWDKTNKKYMFDEDGMFGTYTFEQLQELIKRFEFIVEYLRVMQGREIDGAKTGVYAEGLSGEDFVDLVKIVFTPHNMMTRREILNKPVAMSSELNSYVSLSPLGRIHDYVTMREHEIYDVLENGSNKIFLLNSLLTQEEANQLKMSVLLQDGTTKSLVELISDRKKIYNSKVYAIMKNLTGEEMSEALATLKVREEEDLRTMADTINTSVEIIAVASYIATYTKTSKQNEGLTYAWLLSGELLSVFARGNKKYDLFRLPMNAETVAIRAGFMYVNDKKYIPVKADDCENVLIWRNDGRPYAHVHKRSDYVVEQRQNTVVYGSQLYTIGTYGFKFHIVADNYIEAWKNLVRDNGYEFDIVMDATNRAVLSINGKSISALMVGASFDLMNKHVKLVNNSSSPIKFNNASIENLQVVITGEAR